MNPKPETKPNKPPKMISTRNLPRIGDMVVDPKTGASHTLEGNYKIEWFEAHGWSYYVAQPNQTGEINDEQVPDDCLDVTDDGKVIIGIPAKPSAPATEPKCHICDQPKGRCLDNEYCKNVWAAARYYDDTAPSAPVESPTTDAICKPWEPTPEQLSRSEIVHPKPKAADSPTFAYGPGTATEKAPEPTVLEALEALMCLARIGEVPARATILHCEQLFFCGKPAAAPEVSPDMCQCRHTTREHPFGACDACYCTGFFPEPAAPPEDNMVVEGAQEPICLDVRHVSPARKWKPEDQEVVLIK